MCDPRDRIEASQQCRTTSISEFQHHFIWPSTFEKFVINSNQVSIGTFSSFLKNDENKPATVNDKTSGR